MDEAVKTEGDWSEIDEAVDHAKVVRMAQLLPSWFVPRMADDVWFFGMRLVTGEMLGVTHLDDVRIGLSGQVWLDVDLMTEDDVTGIKRAVVAAPTSRVTASINAAHIVYVVELADT